MPTTTGFAANSASAAFTPAAAAYSAGDVISVAQKFADIAPIRGGPIMITSTVLEIDTTAIISGETSYTLALYSVTPPSAHADNAVWDVPAGDRTAYLGSINLGTPADLGSTLFVEQNGINKQIFVPAGTGGGGHIWGELITVGGFTATAAARNVTLHAIWL